MLSYVCVATYTHLAQAVKVSNKLGKLMRDAQSARALHTLAAGVDETAVEVIERAAALVPEETIQIKKKALIDLLRALTAMGLSHLTDVAGKV